MRIKFVKLGKIAHSEVNPLVDEYLKRISAFAKIETKILRVDETKRAGVDVLNSLATPGELVVLLDEFGKEWTSLEFSNSLHRWMEEPANKSITFLFGPSFGFTDEVRALVKTRWSLSKATLQGDLAWLIAIEQVYRAFSIINRIPYHHA